MQASTKPHQTSSEPAKRSSNTYIFPYVKSSAGTRRLTAQQDLHLWEEFRYGCVCLGGNSAGEMEEGEGEGGEKQDDKEM
jgi:hypothetical protein